MKYEQRAQVAKESFEPTASLWIPAAKDANGERIEVQPEAADHYVVVDEIVGGRVGLVDSAWPTVDAGGRLTFSDPGEPVPKAFGVDEIQKVLDRNREALGQTLRPLRIGDALLVRGSPKSIRSWKLVVDVTAPARLLAKAALFRAISPPREEEPTRAVGAAKQKPKRTVVAAKQTKKRTGPTMEKRRSKATRDRPAQVANPTL